MNRRGFLAALLAAPFLARKHESSPVELEQYPHYVWSIDAIRCSDGRVIARNISAQHAQAVCEELNRENLYRSIKNFDEWKKRYWQEKLSHRGGK